MSSSSVDSSDPLPAAIFRFLELGEVNIAPAALAVTPDGRTLYVAVWGNDVVLPIDVTTGRAGAPIPMEVPGPAALAMTPDGATLYVACAGRISGGGINLANVVIPVDVATGKPGAFIPAGRNPEALAMTPDGATLYSANAEGSTVTPIDTATGRPGTAIRKGINGPDALAVSPDGRTLYVASQPANTVTPVALPG